MSSRPVLILGASTRVAVPVARVLWRECGVESDLVYLLDGAHGLTSRAIRFSLRPPDPRNQPAEFIDALLAFIRRRQHDMLFPVQDAALTAISQHYDVLSSVLNVACPPPHVIERVLNKDLTLQYAQRCGIPIPHSYAVSTAAELDKIANELRFPAVMKPSSARPSPFKARHLGSLDEARQALLGNTGEVLVQEYEPGVGVGIEMLVHKGECLATFQHRRLKEEPASGGVAVLAVAEPPDPALAEAAFQLLRAIEWEGVAMVEFRKELETGRFSFLEVNGRYWGTSSLPILAGMNFPVYHWRVVHEQDPKVAAAYKVGLRWRWSAGYISRLHGLLLRSSNEQLGNARGSKLRELLDLLYDFGPGTQDAVWSWSDPLPAIREFFQTCTEWLRADLKWAVRKLIPKRVLRDREIYQQLHPAAAKIYLKLKVLDALRLSMDNRRRAPSAARSFVFVCHGNIMRSPVAEAMFRRELVQSGFAGIDVCSAGMRARNGKEAHPRAQAAARELGLSMADHRAQRLTPEMVKQADVIFAMDFENKAELLHLYPEARNKIVLLSAYAERRLRYREIADPFYSDLDGTRECYTCIQRCIRELTASLFLNADKEALTAKRDPELTATQ